MNSSEFRQNIDPVPKLELDRLYIRLPNFHKAFFGNMSDLNIVSEAVFHAKIIQEGFRSPLLTPFQCMPHKREVTGLHRAPEENDMTALISVAIEGVATIADVVEQLN